MSFYKEAKESLVPAARSTGLLAEELSRAQHVLVEVLSMLQVESRSAKRRLRYAESRSALMPLNEKNHAANAVAKALRRAAITTSLAAGQVGTATGILHDVFVPRRVVAVRVRDGRGRGVSRNGNRVGANAPRARSRGGSTHGRPRRPA